MPFQSPSRRDSRPLLLIVDDDAAVLDVTRSMARSLGCHALVADTAAQALESFREHAGEIHTLVVDLHMPQIDGLALIRMARDLRSDTRFVLMTGDDVEADTLALAGLGPGCVIVKPFSLDRLRDAVLGDLDQAKAA